VKSYSTHHILRPAVGQCSILGGVVLVAPECRNGEGALVSNRNVTW